MHEPAGRDGDRQGSVSMDAVMIKARRGSSSHGKRCERFSLFLSLKGRPSLSHHGGHGSLSLSVCPVRLPCACGTRCATPWLAADPRRRNLKGVRIYTPALRSRVPVRKRAQARLATQGGRLSLSSAPLCRGSPVQGLASRRWPATRQGCAPSCGAARCAGRSPARSEHGRTCALHPIGLARSVRLGSSMRCRPSRWP